MTGLVRQTTILVLAALAAVMLLVLAPVAWGQARGQIVEGSGGARYVSDELIVAYKQTASPERVRGVGSRFEARIGDTVPEIDARLLSFPDGEGSLARIKETLEANPAVESVDYNYVRELTFTPNDPRFDDQYGLRRIRSPKAWNVVQGNGDMDIAVVDTGIDSDHPDLQAKIDLRKDFTAAPKDPEDDDGHGTHVAGIAAAVTDNGKGVAGACPGCDLFVAKVVAGGRATDADVTDAIVWASDNGAEVVNLSLGGPERSSILKDAVNYAWNHGAVVVAAAGNRGRQVKDYPAAYRNAIAVAATNRKDRRAFYSNFGKWVDVAAPGSGILSTKRGGGYKTMSGTSMSTPHVAGLAGLLAAQGRSAPKIRSRIENTSTDLGPNGKDKYYGHGLINARRAVGG